MIPVGHFSRADGFVPLPRRLIPDLDAAVPDALNPHLRNERDSHK
jgi:hypothetical protein